MWVAVLFISILAVSVTGHTPRPPGCKHDPPKRTYLCVLAGGHCVEKRSDCNGTLDGRGCIGRRCWCCIPDPPTTTTDPPTTTAAATTTTTEEQLDKDENCYRNCTANDVRTCYFKFYVHLYQTLSRACYDCPNNASDCDRPHCIPGDGFIRMITVVNHQMPGPLIQVCVGDRIVVDVQSTLPSGALTIHWHGQTMKSFNGSKASPYMDGVMGVTQCPITPGQLFRYDFVAADEGTHWWHTHTGGQRGDGMYGGLIVREPNDPHLDRYDYDLPEHLIIVHDWLHGSTESKYFLRHHSGTDDFPESMLVNGRGPHQSPTASELSSKIPYKRFKVEEGNRYRFRIVSTAVLNCPITFSIDEHNFTVIASDGNPIDPVDTSSLVMYGGERWDIIISSSQRYGSNASTGLYWMKFMGGVDCAESSAHQFALLEYIDLQAQQDLPDDVLFAQMKSKPNFTRDIPPGVQINSINRACYNDKICVADLTSPHPLPSDLRSEKADHTLYLALEMMMVKNRNYYSDDYYNFNTISEDQQIPTPLINNLSMRFPVTPVLMSRLDMYETPTYCNAESPTTCLLEYCDCLHMYKLGLGEIVDLVMIDEGAFGDENHVMHLHGHHFWVVAQDRPRDSDDANITRAEVMKMDEDGLIERNLVNPVLKDSVTVPDGGYTVVRFKTFNPGYWLVHCHVLFHFSMSVVLQVGNPDEIPPPPFGFPTCSNYQ